MWDPPTILLAEDDDGHARLIQNGLRKAGLDRPLIRFPDGQEVLTYLREAGLPVQPRVLLLDIRMPKIGGIEVLRQVRMNPALDSMPVIMLTTTDDPLEARHCLRLGCNAYVVKPVNPQCFSEALRSLAVYLCEPGPPAPDEMPRAGAYSNPTL
jgi:CheY-like chemotaxis protein